jgi:hypothetical protein
LRKAAKTTQFLNVDLDIYSTSNLEPLITALGKKVFVLYAGRDKRTYSARLELASNTKNADATIRRFCNLIAALPKAGRDLWNTAKVRDFNIGVQAGMYPHSYEIELEEVTVKAASQIHARIVFTVYAPERRQRRTRRMR